MKATDQMINALWRVLPSEVQQCAAGDPENVRPWVEAVCKELEKDYVSRWGGVSSGKIPAELLKYNPEILDHLKTAAQDQAKYMGGTIPDIDTYETFSSDAAFAMDYVTLKWVLRRD